MVLAANNLSYPSQKVVHIMSVDNYAILNISNTSIHTELRKFLCIWLRE